MSKRIEKELYKAAINGDVSFLNGALSRERNSYFLSQTMIQKNNIIHIAVQHNQLDFLKEALRSFPSLICQNNADGDTPLHTASKGGNIIIVKLLVLTFLERESIDGWPRPWEVKNLEGNTPLHVALIHGKVWVASYLVEVGPEVAQFVNKSNETPLHLAIKYSVDGDKKLAIETIQLINSRRVGLTYKGCPLGEDSLSIIQLLLEQNNSAACLSDTHHLTPLLIAALKSYLPAIKAIISECPESTEVCDHSGRTVLHLFQTRSYDEAKELLNITEIAALKDEQDHDGNTPAHIAVENRDAEMVRALFEISANFTTKNLQGVSAAALIHQQNDFLSRQILEINDTEDDFVEANIGMMPAELFISAIEGDVNFLRQMVGMFGKDCLHSRMLSRRNIIHVACQWHNDDGLGKNANWKLFIEEALGTLPILICQTDSKGDTPLHIIIWRYKIDGAFLEMCKAYFKKAKEEVANFNEELYCPPWRVKNVEGSTPLHLALQAGHVSNARKLIEFDSAVIQDVNNDNETILHFLCHSREFTNASYCSHEDLDFIIEANASAVDVRDSDGLTPVLKAASYGSTWLTERIIHHYPRSVMQCDSNGGTILHRMTYSRPCNRPSARKLLEVLAPLCNVKDNDGNTPSHLAIERRNFDVAKLFMEQGFSICDLRNKKGVMPGDLLGSTHDIPRQFQQFLWKRVDVAAQIFGFRTMCGIPNTEIKDYINTMSLTAALQATITFTAAFTVPGGFDSQHGTPILARKVAFGVFLVSDILALCLSMMVLFCLLWVMTGDREEKVVLVDLSLFLLQASFYATLLTFMAGVYVTMFPVVSWLAILPCIACSMLIMLMHKRFIMVLVPCYQVLYSLYQLGTYSVGESVRYVKYKASRAWATACRTRLPTSLSDDGRSSPKFFQVLKG